MLEQKNIVTYKTQLHFSIFFRNVYYLPDAPSNLFRNKMTYNYILTLYCGQHFIMRLLKTDLSFEPYAIPAVFQSSAKNITI